MSALSGLKERLDCSLVEGLQGMCRDREMRMERARAGDATAVDGGIWYGNDCDEMWKLAGRVDELMRHRDKGRLYHGHGPPGYWTKKKDPTSVTGKEVMGLHLKSGKSPSEALYP